MIDDYMLALAAAGQPVATMKLRRVNLRNFRISTRWVRWGDQDPRDAGK
jgi:hypothetical protein